MLFVVLLVSSYIIFWFVGESINPIMPPRGHVRRIRWQHGWFSAALHFSSAYAAIYIAQNWSLDLVLLLSVYVVLSLVGYGVGSILRRLIHGRQQSEVERLNSAIIVKDDARQNYSEQVLRRSIPSNTRRVVSDESAKAGSPTRKLDTPRHLNHQEKPVVLSPDIIL